MPVYIPHTNSLKSIMWPKALVSIHFTLLAYAPEQICLPHCTYRSHCTSPVVYIYTPHYCTHQSVISNIYLPYYCKICATNKYAPQVPYMCQIPKVLDVPQWGKYTNIYATNELPGINPCTDAKNDNGKWWCQQPNYIYCINKSTQHSHSGWHTINQWNIWVVHPIWSCKETMLNSLQDL